MIQFSRFFIPKRLEIDPPTVTHGKEPTYMKTTMAFNELSLSRDNI